jgi:hypothetical protein
VELTAFGIMFVELLQSLNVGVVFEWLGAHSLRNAKLQRPCRAQACFLSRKGMISANQLW